jgi:hypothetical protein
VLKFDLCTYYLTLCNYINLIYFDLSGVTLVSPFLLFSHAPTSLARLLSLRTNHSLHHSLYHHASTSSLQSSWTAWLLKNVPMRFPETSADNWKHILRNNTEEPTPHILVHRGGSLKSRNREFSELGPSDSHPSGGRVDEHLPVRVTFIDRYRWNSVKCFHIMALSVCEFLETRCHTLRA